MGYRWRNKQEVDEAVVVVMNSLDNEGTLKGWLVRTLKQSIADSDAALGTYFYDEIKDHAPAALKFFEIVEG
ncbi:hypothetical protein [Methanolacinia paynteri]|uniref:hypothetical protein n=1 Tax=Methanolacinia paynteri TaxID=230356 RepID=UPI00064E796C|nr:hypothetical protein [Methanolacinia paynteri]